MNMIRWIETARQGTQDQEWRFQNERSKQKKSKPTQVRKGTGRKLAPFIRDGSKQLQAAEWHKGDASKRDIKHAGRSGRMEF